MPQYVFVCVHAKVMQKTLHDFVLGSQYLLLTTGVYSKLVRLLNSGNSPTSGSYLTPGLLDLMAYIAMFDFMWYFGNPIQFVY